MLAVCFLTDPKQPYASESGSPAEETEAVTDAEESNALSGETDTGSMDAGGKEMNYICWIDSEKEEIFSEGIRETSVEDFPDTVFRYSAGEVSAVTDGEETVLYQGMPVWNVYFYDATSDGYPDLCSTCSIGSGVISEYIQVYDFRNGKSYTLHDRMVYDYYLREYRSMLIVEKYAYGAFWNGKQDGEEKVLERGRLVVSPEEADEDGNFSFVPLTIDDELSLPVMTYVCNGRDILKRAEITLYENGTFILSFSPVSSYLGVGTYTEDEASLTLATDDGRYVIALKKDGENMIYSEDGSSLPDGKDPFLSDGMIFSAQKENTESGITVSETGGVKETETGKKAGESPDAEQQTESSGEDTAGEGSDTAPVTELVPTRADLTGVHAGYFFIPIGDSVYRYRIGSQNFSTVTHSEKPLCECTEEALFERFDWKIFSLEEFPEYNILLAVREETDEMPSDQIFLEYAPALSAPESEIEEAKMYDFVMMENGSAVSGKDLWFDFIAKTEAGEEASVRLGNVYTLRGNMSDELREASKEDYPSLFLSELSFDGEGYTLSPLHKINGHYTVYEEKGVDTPVTRYRYLMHYTGAPSSPTALFTWYDKYVLTNTDTVTWKDLEWGMFSSQSGAYIPHAVVYNEYTYK